MRRHTDAVFAAFAGFVLTGVVMAPPVLSARAEKAARIAAYEQGLGPNVTTFGIDRAGRLASAFRGGTYRDQAQQQIADTLGASPQIVR
jgi:hypothetical protein